MRAPQLRYVARLCIRSAFADSIQENMGVSLFSNFSIGVTAATTISEVDNYLSRPVENILDPLKWWTDNQRNYPNLSSMALDYLSIPRKS
jgi:hAT family C-terminal dimerisation region